MGRRVFIAAMMSVNFVNVQYLGATPEDTNEDALIDLAKTLYQEL